MFKLIPVLLLGAYYFKQSALLLVAYDIFIGVGILAVTIMWCVLSAYQKYNTIKWIESIEKSASMTIRRYISGTFVFWLSIPFLIYEQCYLSALFSAIQTTLGLSFHARNYYEIKRIRCQPDAVRPIDIKCKYPTST